eukprot:TRINITY_DN1037_c0_g1_i7.p3 TRINITY_DN1037_c0_g1~~TRINITY_DN1037_c0_g1_i7.p3  ORF type:complete len:159 (+),score=34.60 TRINITY_DN1037_c0_g1_i7:244-720(+)
MAEIEIEGISSQHYSYTFQQIIMFKNGWKYQINFDFKKSIDSTPLLTLNFNTELTNDCTFQPYPQQISIELDNYLYISKEMKEIQKFVQDYTGKTATSLQTTQKVLAVAPGGIAARSSIELMLNICLLYTSDAADEEDSVDLGGRRIIIKKKNNTEHR